MGGEGGRVLLDSEMYVNPFCKQKGLSNILQEKRDLRLILLSNKYFSVIYIYYTAKSRKNRKVYIAFSFCMYRDK